MSGTRCRHGWGHRQHCRQEQQGPGAGREPEHGAPTAGHGQNCGGEHSRASTNGLCAPHFFLLGLGPLTKRGAWAPRSYSSCSHTHYAVNRFGHSSERRILGASVRRIRRMTSFISLPLGQYGPVARSSWLDAWARPANGPVCRASDLQILGRQPVPSLEEPRPARLARSMLFLTSHLGQAWEGEREPISRIRGGFRRLPRTPLAVKPLPYHSSIRPR